MKLKKLAVLTLTTVLIMAFASGLALAQVYDHCADSLVEMGLFTGTNNGYELERVPTRAEAAAVLVRLLGADTEARENQYQHPFTDLKGWEAPYVGYLYEKGLTTGLGGETYGPQQPCNSQMFCTFILRALGYSSAAGGDFTYADAEQFAIKLGVADIISLGLMDFTRDSVMGIAYTALATPMKADAEGKAPLLLQHLVDSGAVDAAKAAPYLQQFADYAALQQVSALEYDGGLEMDFAMTMSMGMAGSDVAEMALSLTSKIKALGDPEAAGFLLAVDNLLAVTGSDAEGQEDVAVDFSIYMKDQVLYLRLDLGPEGVLKYKLDLEAVSALLAEADPETAAALQSYEDLLAEIEAMMPENSYNGNYGIALMGPITIGKSGADTVYTVDMSNLEGYMNAMVKTMGTDMAISDADQAELALVMDGLNYQVNELTATYLVDKKGALKKIDVYMNMGMTVMEETAAMEGTVTMTLVKSGSGMKVALPADLNEYVDIMTLFQEPAPEPAPTAL